MKYLLIAALLLASFSATLADTPAQIAADYRKQAATALVKLKETLEKATAPLVVAQVKAGNIAGADELRE
ncbi:MAG: hypothetical protein K9N47_29550 [Prosthecobacter sp.]|uniref:hypothetical protein n=1 Tax=Prosthecobacter sp. TaxID=1965333 RepID=UPI0026095A76|nr:hypothetical protein [Prosthecobacter sp.]MCF7790301.1 hypothetical protein [Prosthecobacter sp.]